MLVTGTPSVVVAFVGGTVGGGSVSGPPGGQTTEVTNIHYISAYKVGGKYKPFFRL